MTLEELLDYLYKLYEENDNNGEMRVEVSTYSCGSASSRPMREEDWEVRDGALTLVAEDN